MTVAAICMSHSPLLEAGEPPLNVVREVEVAFDAAREFAAAFDPSLVVSFAPDHYNGFFYELMPPFCIGYQASGVGDYGSYEGPLAVPESIAEAMAQHVLNRDIDIAISRRMLIDHGSVQPLEILFGDPAAVPVIPVFVNGVARPFSPMRRIRQLGTAVGQFIAELSEERVLIIGSGGLSHDPPVPQWATGTPPQREALLRRASPSPAARIEREQRVITAGREFSAGTSSIMDLNPDWDRAFMTALAEGDLESIDAYEPEAMAAEAGNSAHEVRTWVAAFNALGASGNYEIASSYYRPIPEYIAGFGVLAATSAH